MVCEEVRLMQGAKGRHGRHKTEMQVVDGEQRRGEDESERPLRRGTFFGRKSAVHMRL